MDVFVRGGRSSARDWSTAQHVSINELPSLDETQKAVAQRGGVSEEAYARTLFAERLTTQRLLQKLLRFGRWLNARIEERDPKVQVVRVELDTLSGKIEIGLSGNGEMFDFEMDEDLVERFLTTGSSEAESSIFRLLDVYVPRKPVAQAS